MFRRPMPLGCTQTAPNFSALRTPVHLATGCGARHRNSSMGGAANGMPLNTRTPGAAPGVPESRPASVLTGSGTAARKALTSASETRKTTLFFIVAFVLAYSHFTGDRDEGDMAV